MVENIMTQESSNLILQVLKREFDSESYLRLQQVLDFLPEVARNQLFDTYLANLKAELESLAPELEAHPDDPKLSEYIVIKYQFYSFRFIGQVGVILITLFRDHMRYQAEETLIKLFKLLVHHGLVAKSHYVSFALVELEQLCKKFDITLPILYQRYRRKLLRVIVKAILKKLENNRDGSGSGNGLINGSSNTSSTSNTDKNGVCDTGVFRKNNPTVIYMVRALGIFDVTEFSHQDIAQSLVIVSYLLWKDKLSGPIEIFLRHLANYYTDRKDIASLLNVHMETIMVSLLLEGKMSAYDMTELLKKLCTISDKSNIRELLADKFTSIKSRLILHYSIDEKKVKDALFHLCTWQLDEIDQPFTDAFDDDTIFIEYLQPVMIGILLGIDNYINSTATELGTSDTISYINSLKMIISKLTDKQVATIHHKLLSTLCLLLRLRKTRDINELNIALVGLWEVFINKLEKELRSALLINICVALHDLIEDCPHEVAKIYSQVILGRHTREEDSKLKCLFFIPDGAEFEKIYQYLNAYVRRGNKKQTIKELELALECALPLTKFENQKCHILAVARIRELLKSNQDLLISDMLTNSDEPLNDLISRTIESLLLALSTQECSGMIAECLGIIGAVNPVRLSHLIYGNIGAGESIHVDINSKAFTVNLIEKLKNSLLSDRLSESETASYALQVVLGINIKQIPQITKELSEQAKKACELCKDTFYNALQRVPPDMSIPLYTRFKNECQYSYKDWLDKFFLVLLPMVENASTRTILHACTFNFKHNIKFAEYLYPIVLMNLMLSRSANVEIIQREIMAIINDTVSVSSQDYDTVLSDDYENNPQTLHFQCANFVFLLMDSLSRFERLIKKPEKSREMIRDLLRSIPKDNLALLACKCRAYARALYYFDQYYFEAKDWNRKEIVRSNPFDKYWTSLQKVYMALDDPYEAAGVQMRRTSPITVTDEIANLESAGKFDKAILHYDSLLESTYGSFDRKQLVEDALKCLSNQGNDRRLYERSRHLMDQYPIFKRSILPAAVEAFWKLGKWDELDYSLKHDACISMLDSTSVCQGLLLNTLNNSHATIPDQLKIVCERSIRPLSIAMIDRSAYFRGYQNLLVLHRIEDFSLVVDALGTKHFDTQSVDENTVQTASEDLMEKVRSILRTWNKRNKLVEPSLRSLEPLLSWQRSITLLLMNKYPFVQTELCQDVGSMWLSSADAARDARCFDRSFYCLAQAKHWFGQDLLKNNLQLSVKCTIAQAKLNWEQGESTEALKCLMSSIQQLHGHKLFQHLEIRKTKSADIRRKTSNPYNHPDDEPYPDINHVQCEECCTHSLADRESFARLKILLTSYTEEAAAGTPRALLNMYEECVHLGVDQEEVYLLLARYYDKLANYYTENPHVLILSEGALNASVGSPASLSARIAKTDKVTKTRKTASQDKKDKEIAHREDIISKLMEQSILAFGNSLKNGARYLEESMPRMLNIWFDLGSKKCLETMAYYPRAINSRIESTLRMFETLLLKKESKGSLPSYYFMTALSLLLSRVCHPNPGICLKTSLILEQLLIDYPHQILWRLQAMLNDDNDERKKAADRIIKSACKKVPALTVTIVNYRKFSNLLRDIAINHSTVKPMTQNAREKPKKLPSICSISDIVANCGNLTVQGNIIPPVQSSMNPILPTESDFAKLRDHKIYPEHYMTYVKRIKNECQVFNSMQAPRKIVLVCDNGKEIQILCKPGDDLRKDARVIEFFNLLNRILRRSSQSNVRHFEIVTYFVLPLEDRAGLLEMVPNCDTIRKIIDPLYREQNGERWTTHDLMKKCDGYHQSMDAELYQRFVDKILPTVTPPVLQKFFTRKFSEPIRWYLVKLAYARTLALSSMVGYIVGLGDRHLDNILIDQSMGRVVHVDYNLLFHQAECLAVPETVPFRLTHNIIAPLGPMGTEGNFRKYCEIAMRVMRKEKELLLTTLKPFLHDPCCEWTKDRDNRTSKDKDLNQDGNRTARDRIEVCERKLKGFPRVGNHSKPLTILKAFSVEAQVDTLIEEATDLYSLSKMYYGWCPHI